MSRSKVKPDVSIVNVVATVKLGRDINLRRILEKIPQAEYDPRRFPGLVYRLDKPKTAILIFGSGNMVITGAKTEASVKKAVDKLIQQFEDKGIISGVKPQVKIENVVASGNLKGYIDLEGAAYELEFTIYEPEEFPGLIYRMDDPNVVILLFSSGKIVCTGARAENEVYEAVEKLQRRLEEANLIEYT